MQALVFKFTGIFGPELIFISHRVVESMDMFYGTATAGL